MLVITSWFRLLERVRANLDFKILILGAGESGKSTVIKQLKNVHLGKAAVSDAEKASFVSVLHTNTIQAVKTLIQSCKSLDIPFGEMEELVELLLDFDETQLLTFEDAEKIVQLWESESFQACFARKSEVYFPGRFLRG